MGKVAGERQGEISIKVITQFGLFFRVSEAKEEILIQLPVVL